MLLDVDGVINDLGALGGHRRPWKTVVVQAGRFHVHVPEFMPPLIQGLAEVTEIHWCTTWRESANTLIAPLLGVSPFPVITDGSESMYPDWKASAAHDVVTAALAQNRRVVWIEDFYGEYPVDVLPDGVEYIDTATTPGGAVLVPEMVPADLVRG
ncbi:MAG: hypothetical protein WD990_07675 [Acidimicrobiia bacterium]